MTHQLISDELSDELLKELEMEKIKIKE